MSSEDLKVSHGHMVRVVFFIPAVNIERLTKGQANCGPIVPCSLMNLMWQQHLPLWIEKGKRSEIVTTSAAFCPDCPYIAL